jgi:hypothetical protein
LREFAALSLSASPSVSGFTREFDSLLKTGSAEDATSLILILFWVVAWLALESLVVEAKHFRSDAVSSIIHFSCRTKKCWSDLPNNPKAPIMMNMLHSSLTTLANVQIPIHPTQLWLIIISLPS